MSVIILGAGKIGYNLAQELSMENRDVTVIDSNPQKIQQLEEAGDDIIVMEGNASNPAVLKKAGVENAELLIAVTAQDSSNIAACHIASRFSKTIKKIARVREIDTHLYGELFTGENPIIDSIINPEELCAIKISHLLDFPGIMDINSFFDDSVHLLGIKITEDSPIKGKSLIEIGQEREKLKIKTLIAGIIRGEEILVPSGKNRVEEGDIIYVISLQKKSSKVVEYFCGPQKRIKNVSIIGGSNIAYYLARIIETKVDLKLIEPDHHKAHFLSEELKKTLVLKGTLLEKAIYEQESIDSSDVFIAASGDQEENIIATLYAKSKGVKKGICVLRRQHLTSFVNKTGIDVSIHPQQLTIGKILEYIRKGHIYSVVVLGQNAFEVIEAKINEKSKLSKKELKNIKLPKGTLLLTIERRDGTIVIPDGNTVVKADERVLFIAQKNNIPALEALIA